MLCYMRYPGGKGRCYQQIINLLPPHNTYIESHLGGGAVMRHKQPSSRNIGIDIDDRVIAKWRAEYPGACDLVNADANTFLRNYPFCGGELVYCDPPYLSSTRRRNKVYRFDYTESDHEELLVTLRALPCMVVLSGYASSLYQSLLSGWHQINFPAKTHAGLRTETVWINFERPKRLHDPRYMGKTFREREVIKRRHARLKSRLTRLPPAERHALADWILNSGEFIATKGSKQHV